MIEDSEKKYVYAVIAIVSIILIGVIVIIWMPAKVGIIESELNKISEYGSYDAIQKEKYRNLLNRVLLVSNFDELYEILDENWIKENNFENKDEVKAYLLENFYITNSTVNFSNIEVLSSDSAYIFKYTIENNGEAKNIIINEYTPYEYDITFDQKEVSALSGKTYEYLMENVEYTITTSYVGENIIQYELNILNNSDDEYIWDNSKLSSITLGLSDGTAVGCSDTTTFANNFINLNKGGTLNIKLTFNLSFERQSLINSITLSNMIKNNSNYSVKILLSGGE